MLREIDDRLRRLRPWSLPFLVACAIPALFVAFVIGMQKLPAYFRLSLDGRHAQGIISRTDCGRHPRFEYRFHLAEREVTGIGFPRNLEKECARLVAGDAVPVIYAAGRPEVSEAMTSLPRALIRELSILFGLCAACFIATAALLVAARRTRPVER